MSDTKLDPRSLNAEERALFHQVAIVLLSSGSYEIRGAQLDALTYVAESRNLFGQGESEAKATREVNRLPEPSATDVFATDRAIGVQAMNAEDVPAATEMPEAVKNAWKALRKENYETFALALEFWWRTHAAQPVGITEALENILRWETQRAKNLRRESLKECHKAADEIDAAIAAVRRQAAHGQGPKLEKVRNGLESAKHRLCCLTSEVFTPTFTDRYADGDACRKVLGVVQRGIEELDAYEKGGG